jgi:hypothetical protein
MHQHVRRFEANAGHSSQQPNHRMRPFGRRLFEPLQTGRLNLSVVEALRSRFSHGEFVSPSESRPALPSFVDSLWTHPGDEGQRYASLLWYRDPE